MPLLNHQDPLAFRHANRLDLAVALADSRERLLRLAAAYAECLPPDQTVRYTPEVNPPRWQLGHAGWYEEFWLVRNPLRRFGERAPYHDARGASLLPNADALFDPARSTQARRWHLDLPSPARLRRYLEQVRERTFTLLETCDESDDALYPFRLAVLHADRLLEDWAAMGQALALPVGDGLEAHAPQAPQADDGEIAQAARRVEIGVAGGAFALDHERPAHAVELAAFNIDRHCVSWARYLPFIEEGGYERQDLWSDAGWAWRQRHSAGRPRYLMREDGVWQRAAFAQWTPLVPTAPAVNLSRHEAEAWCRWAGRRLPTEAEWESAATAMADDGFTWGQVREWTASPFVPYEGFEPAPDRSLSMPLFDGRPVVRGASFAASPRLRHPRARGALAADRNDVFTGFRSCASA